MNYLLVLKTKDKRIFYINEQLLITRNINTAKIFTHWKQCEKAAKKYNHFYRVFSINDLGEIKLF